MVAACDQLLALGLVEARKNQGFFRRQRRRGHRRRGRCRTGPDPGKRRRQLEHRPLVCDACCGAGAGRVARQRHGAHPRHVPQDQRQAAARYGRVSAEWLESTFMPAAVRKVKPAQSCKIFFSLQYGELLGDAHLRRLLAKKLSTLNVHTGARAIIITVGPPRAGHREPHAVAAPGDPVWWRSPVGRWSLRGWRPRHAHPARAAPRRRARPEVMAAIAAHQPKLYVSVSVFHNPTGYCLSPGSPPRCSWPTSTTSTWWRTTPTATSRQSDATRLTALDGLQRTIYVSGFAKILAPNWRIGYLAAPPNLVEPLLDTKLLATLTTPALLEKALALCGAGQLRRHAERIRTRLDAARSRSVKLALQAGCFCGRAGGPVQLGRYGRGHRRPGPAHAGRGLPAGPGALFHAERKPSTLMRINFATTQEAAFWQIFQQVVAAMK